MRNGFTFYLEWPLKISEQPFRGQSLANPEEPIRSESQFVFVPLERCNRCLDQTSLPRPMPMSFSPFPAGRQTDSLSGREFHDSRTILASADADIR